MLQQCLVVDVARRITAPDLRRHPFVTAGLQNGQMAGGHVGALVHKVDLVDEWCNAAYGEEIRICGTTSW